MVFVDRRAVFSLLVVLPICLASPLARADQASEAKEFVDQMVSHALGTLADKQMSEADREKNFAEILGKDFDIPRISRFVLGRYWGSASDADRNQFMAAYQQYIVRSYASRFGEYSGETVKVTGARPEGDAVVVVTSDIIHPDGDPPAKVSWRVHKGEEAYKIVDVDVEGVSMMLTQREEFASVIQRSGGTVSGLTQAIEAKIRGDESGG
jgi:phospholipid transport system substrate-binding protein